MNQDQMINLIQTLGKVAGGLVAGYGAAAQNILTASIGLALALVSWYFSHRSNATNPPGAGTAVLWILGLLLLALPVKAQPLDTNNAPTINTVWTQVTTWLGTYNTNLLTFQGSGLNISLWNGPKDQSGLNVADTFGLDIDVWKSSATNGYGFTLDSMVDLSTVNGPVSGLQFGPGLTKTIWDVRFGAFVDAGKDLVKQSWFVDPCVEINKAWSPSTSSGIKVGLPFYFKGQNATQVPTIWLKLMDIHF